VIYDRNNSLTKLYYLWMVRYSLNPRAPSLRSRLLISALPSVMAHGGTVSPKPLVNSVMSWEEFYGKLSLAKYTAVKIGQLTTETCFGVFFVEIDGYGISRQWSIRWDCSKENWTLTTTATATIFNFNTYNAISILRKNWLNDIWIRWIWNSRGSSSTLSSFSLPSPL
jgi:hypothetical protein